MTRSGDVDRGRPARRANDLGLAQRDAEDGEEAAPRAKARVDADESSARAPAVC
jgi:hypothetical protein